ncbi:MAG TPA: acyltransferase family protein [Gemmatimonadaceae bacterium]|nr:acyltransferase family protein [Gemmatimonadaceae bacterium]
MTVDSTTAPTRRHDLDWLRAIAILLLLFFHSAMPFATDMDWHLKSAETSDLLREFNFFVSRFRMALLFVIAGVAAQFVLRRRSVGGFLRDRALRLLVPLTFGIFVVVPPQIYFEWLAKARFEGSYLAFWPQVLEFVPYPQGAFSYHHLWFIFYLFLYSALLVPLLAAARTPRGAERLARVRAWIARHSVHWLALPIVAAYALLLEHFTGVQDIVHDGAMFLTYFLYFATGWLIGIDAGIWQRILDGRRASLTAAFLMLLVITGLRWNHARPETGFTPERVAYLALLAAHAWCWVMAILGYGRRWLDRDHPVLAWTRDASYPFYILHQTVIVAVAYYVIPTQESVIAKFLFTSIVSLVVSVGLYETLVRPYAPVRWLFGMAPRRSSPAVAPAVSPSASPASAPAR